MNPEELIQRSDAWWLARTGFITASRIGDMMATLQRGGWAKTRQTYFNELIAERLSGRPTIKVIRSLEARAELEPEARSAYEFYAGVDVKEIGFVPHPKIERSGASPDGFIKKDGQLEIKCLDPAAHIELLTSEIIDNDYILQMQFNMACSKRKWCDFFSYSPTLPEEMKTFKRRIERDGELIGRIEQAVRDFDAEIEAKIATLRNGSRATAFLGEPRGIERETYVAVALDLK